MIEPKLRFKADDGSQFPDWEEKTLGDMTVELQDYVPLSSGYPLMTSSRTGLMMQNEFRSKSSTDDSTAIFSVVPRGVATYRHMSDDDIFHFNINNLVDKGLVSKEYPVFNTKDNYNLYLLVEYLNSSRNFLNFCKAQKKGGTRTRLYFKVLKDFKLNMPSLPEQQKIVEFLSTIDTVIEKQKETVSAWEERKKGVMQKLFNQEVRFKADDGSEFPEWEEKILDEEGFFYGGLTGKNKDDFEKGSSKFITYMNVYKNTFANQDMMGTVNVGITEKQNKVLYGDILFAQSSETVEEVGLSSVYLYDDEPYLNSFCMGFRFNDLSNVCPKYMGYCMRSENIRKNIMLMGQGISRINLGAKRLKTVSYKIPCLAEQQKIADCLSSLDEVIEKQRATLAAWEEMKKGLLQQMFV